MLEGTFNLKCVLVELVIPNLSLIGIYSQSTKTSFGYKKSFIIVCAQCLIYKGHFVFLKMVSNVGIKYFCCIKLFSIINHSHNL